MRVLDAFRPRGTTWSGQVISSPPGPSGGPSKTHLLPGGGVPRGHRARSPVAPRLPRFATPRSVHQFAAVAAGAYPLCRPPNAWSPGAPAPPGPCYWLVSSGTPLGWRGGCLPQGLGRGAVRHYCLGGCSSPVRVCAALGAGSGGSGRYLVLCLSRFTLPAPCVPRCVWRAVPSGCPLPSLGGTPFHAVCAFCELGPVALLVVPACPLRVCALALPWHPLPPPWVVWRAHLTRSWHWALVAPFHVFRAPSRVLPRSLAPSGVLWGGGDPVPVPPYLAWPARPVGAVCRGGGWGPSPGGGAACHCCEGRLVSGAVPPATARPLGRAAGVPRPVCSGCGRCGRGDPALAPQRAPLRGGFARCGGGGRASPGGVPSTVVRGV